MIKVFLFFSGDSIPRNTIPLDEVIIFQPLKFKSYNEAREYLILRQRPLRYIHMQKLAAVRLEKLNERLKNLKSKVRGKNI